MIERSIKLAALSSAMLVRAKEMADSGQTIRAMRVAAIAEALHHAAGGDIEAKRDALLCAKKLRAFEARNEQTTNKGTK